MHYTPIGIYTDVNPSVKWGYIHIYMPLIVWHKEFLGQATYPLTTHIVHGSFSDF